MASILQWVCGRSSVLPKFCRIGRIRWETPSIVKCAKLPRSPFTSSPFTTEAGSPELPIDKDSLAGDNERIGDTVEGQPECALFQPIDPNVDDHKYKEGGFEDLFRNSQFIQARDPIGKEVEGVIIAIHQDKLYVDFGCKFHAVISPDDTLNKSYSVGQRISVVLEDLEVIGQFIGDNKQNSLMEAQAKLGQLI